MTTYNTGNPIGSKDPRDLYDNAENLDVAVNDDAATWVDRLGVQRSTLWQMLEYSKQFNDRGDWHTSTAYARKDYFTYSGITYVTLTAHTSTSVAADLAAGKIGVMSGNSGAMDFLQQGNGAVARTVQNKLRDYVSVTDFGASTAASAATNQAAFAAALATGKAVYVPMGTYNITGDISGTLFSEGKPQFVGGLVDLAPGPFGDYVTNTFYGRGAGKSNTPLSVTQGRQNTFIGNGAGSANTTGYANTALGFAAGSANVAGSGNTFIGYQTNMIYDASFCCAMGVDAGMYNSGNYNTLLGWHAGASSNGLSGTRVTAIGAGAANAHTTGNDCVFVGSFAGQRNTTGIQNVFVGSAVADNNTTGSQNTYIGNQCAKANQTGNYNCLVGHYTAYKMQNSSDNTAVGALALFEQTTGSQNTAIGQSAGRGIKTGAFNTFIGYYAGFTGQVESVSNTTAIGHGAYTTGNNSTVIGNQAYSTEDNQFVLGNRSIAKLSCAVTSITALSDARDKKDVVDVPIGLDFICALRPVRFTWNCRDNSKVNIVDHGFIAQELQGAQEAHDAEWLGLVDSKNLDRLETTPGKLLPILVKAIQELKAEFDAYKLAHP